MVSELKGNLAIISLSCLFQSKFSHCDLCNNIRLPSLLILLLAMIHKSFAWLILGILLNFILRTFVLWDLHQIGYCLGWLTISILFIVFFIAWIFFFLGWKNLMFHSLFILNSMDIIMFSGHKQCVILFKVADYATILLQPLFNQSRKKMKMLKNLLIVLRNGIAKIIK